MQITKLEILGFGKFHNFSLDFSSKCNVIYGENEAGKSTLHSFIQAMLYGIPSAPSKKEEFFRYLPFSKNEMSHASPTVPMENAQFGGSLYFHYQNEDYRISRDFSNGGEAKICRMSCQKPIANPDLFLEEVLSSFSLESFKNTVSIRQLKSTTEREMVKELQSIFSNTEHSGNININPSNAISILEEEERRLKEQIYFQAEKEYNSLLGEAKNAQKNLVEDSSNTFPNNEDLLSSNESSLNEAKRRSNSLALELDEKISEIARLQNELNTLEGSLNRESFKSIEEAVFEEKKLEKLLIDLQDDEGKKKHSRLFPLLLLFISFVFLFYAIFSGLYFYSDLSVSEIFSLRINGIPLLYPCLCFFVFFFIFACTIYCEGKKKAELEKQKEQFYNEVLQKRRIADYASHMNSSKEEVEGTSSVEFFSPYIIKAYYSEIKKNFEEIVEKKKELEAINLEISILKEEEKKEREEERRLQEKEDALESNLRQVSTLQKRAEQIRPSIYENERFKEKLEAIEEAKERIELLSKEIYQSFAFYLNKESGKILSHITKERYDSLFIDQNLRIFVNTEKKLLPLEQASTGTIDQLYLSLRLATATLLQKEKKEFLPLLFDDSFAMYDESRLSQALSFISKEYPSQILLFTCHKRESEILRSLNIPYKLLTI